MYLLPKGRDCGAVATLHHTPAIGGVENNYSQEQPCFLIACLQDTINSKNGGYSSVYSTFSFAI